MLPTAPSPQASGDFFPDPEAFALPIESGPAMPRPSALPTVLLLLAAMTFPACAPDGAPSAPQQPPALAADLTPDDLSLIAIDAGRPDHQRVEALLRLAADAPQRLVEPVAGAIRQLLATLQDATLRAKLAPLAQ